MGKVIRAGNCFIDVSDITRISIREAMPDTEYEVTNRFGRVTGTNIAIGYPEIYRVFFHGDNCIEVDTEEGKKIVEEWSAYRLAR